LVIATSVLVVGCASTASTRSIQAIEGNLSQYKNAFVTIRAAPFVQAQMEFQHVGAGLSTRMVNKLKASGLFQEVSENVPLEATESDLKIVVTVDQFVYGTKLEGLTNVLPLVGPRLGVQVEMFNAKTGQKLAHLESVATSSDSYAQSEAIAENIVTEIIAKGRIAK
jgi:hypothetical protein